MAASPCPVNPHGCPMQGADVPSTRTGSIPCERGRWEELGEYVDHRRRDARRQLEDIKDRGSTTARGLRAWNGGAGVPSPRRVPSDGRQRSAYRARSTGSLLSPPGITACRWIVACFQPASRSGSRTERIVRGAEPLAADLAPFRSVRHRAVRGRLCEGMKRPPARSRAQRGFARPSRRRRACARSGARSRCAAAAAPAALDSVPAAASVWVRAACDHVPPGGIPAAGRPGDDRHVDIPDCRSFRWRRRRHPGCRSCCWRSASAASAAPLAAPAPSSGCPSYRWRQHRRHPSSCSRCP